MYIHITNDNSHLDHINNDNSKFWNDSVTKMWTQELFQGQTKMSKLFHRVFYETTNQPTSWFIFILVIIYWYELVIDKLTKKLYQPQWTRNNCRTRRYILYYLMMMIVIPHYNVTLAFDFVYNFLYDIIELPDTQNDSSKKRYIATSLVIIITINQFSHPSSVSVLVPIFIFVRSDQLTFLKSNPLKQDMLSEIRMTRTETWFLKI